MMIFGYSILLLSNRVSAQWTSDRMLAATGSSIPFPGTDKEFKNVHWDLSVSNQNQHVLDMQEGNIIIYENYKNRIQVNSSDGSFQLKDVGKADSGRYKMTVDLDQPRTRFLTLEVIDPLSTPSISCEYNPENHMAVLNWTVQRGRATSILWSREGVVLPVSPWQSLSDGNVTFIIWNAEKSDSGNYTCSVENQVSRTNITYQLAIEDHEPNPRSQDGLYLTIIVVITVVLVFISLLVLAWTAFPSTHWDYNIRYIGTSPSIRSTPVHEVPMLVHVDIPSAQLEEGTGTGRHSFTLCSSSRYGRVI
ncbi:junctional adhesion molecule A-like isoform X2 [Leucoraja erinacea]|uniref:junctional adhesion molecule A-like isoform X2 n=1 Tax=Leucoraja erinaceus TaxID=7782 RepID=UPI0024541239|nr:junctional adhesion molecule A-like isoform X2 [Leucoraja erinacea]XP_055521132.1 junctional adhesion molecule A-like isoform X2 [Leucoraja erinacea]